jgi:hypothetical protein
MTARKRTALLHRSGIALVFAIGLALAVVHVVSVEFGLLREFDDQGSAIETARPIYEGFAPYDDVYSQYGPTYHFVNWTAQCVYGHSLDHRTVRFTSIALWLAGFVVLSIVLGRTTRSLPLSILGSALLLYMLTLCFDAGHPQDVCVLIVALAALVETEVLPPRASMAARGGLAAALLLTKINLGLFLLAGYVCSVDIPWRPLRWVVGALALALPATLMREHLGGASTYALVATLSIGAAWRRRETRPIEGLAWGAAAFGAVAALILGWALVRGSTLGGMFHALVTRAAAIPGNHFRDPKLRWWHAVAAVVVAGAALPLRRPGPWSLGGRGLAGLAIAWFLASWRFPDALGFAPPILWSAIGGESARSRTSLVFMAVFQSLGVYPLTGGHFQTSLFLTVVIAAICLADVVCAIPVGRGTARSASIAGTLAGLGLMGGLAQLSRSSYQALTPLCLPASEGVRSNEWLVAADEWLVHNLRTNADAFVTLPGLPSLYTWTGIAPPTHANVGPWPTCLERSDEEAVVRALREQRRVAAVRNIPLVYFWVQGVEINDRPLVRYIREHFVPCATFSQFELMFPPGTAPTLTYLAIVNTKPDGRSLRLVLPRLTGRLERVQLPAADSTEVIFDSASVGPGESHQSLSPARGGLRELPIDLDRPREMTFALEAERDGRAMRAGCLVVRLLGAQGERLGTVPVFR